MAKATQENTGLEFLTVLDSLEVGPVVLSPNRLSAPYHITIDGQRHTNELVYRFEEAVFDLDEAESHNLAALMASQVALNYGLFCETIVFNGHYDKLDRNFIRTMAENTAREIYVKKILEPNPFLHGLPTPLPALKRKRYCNARIRFVSPKASEAWHLWPTDENRFCILSSGGKDSLLSFGIMDEVVSRPGPLKGGQVHPIFVNESGRHWFTALNAYRHFQAHVPNSARVWVNSDRIFNWVLRHLPFIRKNFADIRADQYPLRLWTVAVFLFGVLPLMRKRGLGCLIIGDEFDTTERQIHAGIPHYDGLFDQSVYFDNALSRYFMQKGWSVRQFSILRPLSELLIEKILVKRYAHLQDHQTSCHATHKKNERMLPCGRCEKCRRIVGMLTALEADATRCGYTPDQIKACLQQLVRHGAHQEAAGLSHLLFLLKSKNLLPENATLEQPARPHPEIMKLRFDQQHSPLNAIPMALRKPVYEIFLQHAQGALRKVDKRWEPTDVLTGEALTRPYAFELPEARGAAGGAKAGLAQSEIRWGRLSWPTAGKRLSAVDIALLPVGAMEQHGPHLPLDTDAFDARYLALRTAEACSDPKPLVLPLIAYGVSYHHDDFAGTVSIGNETLSKLVYDIGMSTAKNGIRKLVVINGHGGNSPALNYAAQMINRDARIFVCVDTGETSDVDIDKIVTTQNDVHAGEIETSTSLALRPHLVHLGQAVKAVPRFSSRYLNFSSTRGVSWYAYTQKISKSGIMGDPTRASAAKGKRIWQIMIAHMVAFVEDLKRMTLDEIHQRRY